LKLFVDYNRLIDNMIIVPIGANEENRQLYLGINYKGLTAFEQLLFNKIILYDSFYHHHKIRAADSTFETIFKKIYQHNSNKANTKKCLLKGLAFEKVSDFIAIDEYDFFGASCEEESIRDMIVKLKYRNVYHRVLVISHATINDAESQGPLYLLLSMIRTASIESGFKQRAKDLINIFENVKDKIVNKIQAEFNKTIDKDKINFSVPKNPNIRESLINAYIEVAPDYYINMNELNNTTDLQEAYYKDKYRIYLFAPREDIHLVAKAAYNVFCEEGLKLYSEAFIMAKVPETVYGNLGSIRKHKAKN
jgi:HD superfamily phosphohydrolase